MQEPQKIIRLQSNKRSYSVYTRESTVRQAEALPKRRPHPAKTQEEWIREERRKRWERNVRKHAIEREIKNRYQKVNIWSIREMLMIESMLAVMLGSCIFFLHQQASVSELIRANSRLEAEYAELVRENNIRSSQIETGVDYNAIYDYAVNTLGMKYPEKSQVIYYRQEERGNVYQADDIPGKSE